MDPRPLGHLCGREADPTSVLVVLHKVVCLQDETGTGGVTTITLSTGRPPSRFHDGCYLIETTRRTGGRLRAGRGSHRASAASAVRSQSARGLPAPDRPW